MWKNDKVAVVLGDIQSVSLNGTTLILVMRGREQAIDMNFTGPNAAQWAQAAFDSVTAALADAPEDDR